VAGGEEAVDEQADTDREGYVSRKSKQRVIYDDGTINGREVDGKE